MEIGVLWTGLAMGGALCALLAASWRPDGVIRYAGLVLAGLLGVSVLAAGFLIDFHRLSLDLRVDPSTTPLLPINNPAEPIYRKAVRDFGDDEIYAIALSCEEVFEPGCLRELDQLSTRVAQLDGVKGLSSLLDVTHFRWVEEEDWVAIRPFMEEIPEDPATLARLRAQALADPVYRQTLVGEDARAAALNLGFQKMDDAAFLASGLDDRIAGLLAQTVADPDRVHVAGRPHVKVHVYRGILRDLLVLIPISAGVMALVLFYFFRRARGVWLPLGTAVLGNLWTFGLMAALDQSLTLLTGLLSPLLLALGSVYGVHVMARFEEEAATLKDPAAAALACLEHVRLPALIAAITTMIGFGALLITDVPAVFDFGLFAMLGIASCSVIALVGIPACLSKLASDPGAQGGGGSGRSRLDRGLMGWADGVSRRTGVILGVWCALAVVSAALIPRIEVDTDYLSHFSADDPVRLDFEAVNRSLAGVVPIYVVIEASEPGGLREPALLQSLDELQQNLGEVPGVSRTLSFLDSLRKLNRAFHAGDPAEQRVPETRGAISELLFMLPKDEMRRFITVDHTRANLIVRTGAVGSASILQLEDDLQSVLDEHPLPHGARAYLTGNTLLLSRSADGITRGQPWSVGLAALAIFVLISLALRSPRLGAVAMVPNLIPVLLFFGALGSGVAPLSLPVSLIGSMALGIAIDDTVHYLVRYGRERKAGADPEEASRLTARRVGRPIVITSVMLFGGFLLVTISPFATVAQFGALAAMTMGVCLATDLMLLPALLVRWRI